MTGSASKTETHPGLALEDALVNLGGNEDLYLKLVHLFLEQHGSDATLIHLALTRGDWKLALHLAHALRGAAGTIGACALHDAARALEDQLVARANAPRIVPANLKVAMDELLPSLRHLVAKGLA